MRKVRSNQQVLFVATQVALVLCLCGTLRGQAAGLTAPWKQQSMPQVYKGQQKSFPRISNGYFLAIPRTLTPDRASASVVMTTASTGVTSSFPFALTTISTTASSERLEDAAVTPGGGILVVGSYTQPASPLVTVGNFVAVMSNTGSLLSVINTGNYTPDRVCAATDGTFWTLGQIDSMEAANNLTYNLLRHYETSGTLVGSYLTRSTIHAARTPLDIHFHEQTASVAFLSCGTSSVGAYIGAGSIWFEVASATGVASQWTIQRLDPNAVITGVALLASQSVYATVALTGPASATEPGLYHLTLNDAPGPAVWTSVAGPLSAPNRSLLPNVVRLAGTDQNSLVLLNGRPGLGQLSWIKP